MTEEIDKHVLKKYEIQQKLGKGVCRGALVDHALALRFRKRLSLSLSLSLSL